LNIAEIFGGRQTKVGGGAEFLVGRKRSIQIGGGGGSTNGRRTGPSDKKGESQAPAVCRPAGIGGKGGLLRSARNGRLDKSP